MNKIIDFSSSISLALYYKYKEYIISLLIIVVCFILLFVLIIPQIQILSQIKREESDILERIHAYEKNERFLAQLNSEQIDSQLQFLVTSLPSEKNFAGILYALSLSTHKANVILQDYSFKVGDVSSSASNQPYIQMNVSILGGIDGAKNFIKVLSQIIPLSDTQTIQTTNNSSTLSIVFYFKSFFPPKFDSTIPLASLTPKESETLKQVSSFTDAGTYGNLGGVSSSSGLLLQ